MECYESLQLGKSEDALWGRKRRHVTWAVAAGGEPGGSQQWDCWEISQAVWQVNRTHEEEGEKQMNVTLKKT